MMSYDIVEHDVELALQLRTNDWLACASLSTTGGPYTLCSTHVCGTRMNIKTRRWRLRTTLDLMGSGLAIAP